MVLDRKHLLFAIIFGLFCGLLLLLLPRLLAIASFFLAYDSLKELFFARIGLSGAVSDLVAGILIFFMPLATFVLFANVMAVWSGRASFDRLAKVSAAYAFVYLLPAAVTAFRDVVGGPQCFDQRKGEARLFYSIENGGAIILSDVSGFDRFGVERKPVTSEICRIADRQKSGVKISRITGDLRQIQFFDAAGGGARVFYSRNSSGKPELFDGPGVNPSTNAILAPISAEVVDEVLRGAAIENQQRDEAERRRAQDAARQAADIARQQAESRDRAAREEATRRQNEVDRANLEADSAKRAEEARLQRIDAERRAKDRAAQEERDRQRRVREQEAQAQMEHERRMEQINRAAAAAKGCTYISEHVWSCPGN